MFQALWSGAKPSQSVTTSRSRSSRPVAGNPPEPIHPATAAALASQRSSDAASGRAVVPDRRSGEDSGGGASSKLANRGQHTSARRCVTLAGAARRMRRSSLARDVASPPWPVA